MARDKQSTPAGVDMMHIPRERLVVYQAPAALSNLANQQGNRILILSVEKVQKLAQKHDLAMTPRDFSPATRQREGRRPEAGFEMTGKKGGSVNGAN